MDLSNETNYYGLISDFIEENNLNIVCFTATTPQISIVHQFCEFISSNFCVKIILGGPHITLMYSSFEKGTESIKEICHDHINKLLKCIDTVVIGDGEYAIVDAINDDKEIINSEQNPRLFLKHNYD